MNIPFDPPDLTDPPSTSRYSVTFAVTQELLDILKDKYSLCCAWGFRSGSDGDVEYNVIGWSVDGLYPRQTVTWTEGYLMAAGDKGCVPDCVSLYPLLAQFPFIGLIQYQVNVNEVTRPLSLKPSQQFVVKDFTNTTVQSLPVEPPKPPADALSFQTYIPCSIILFGLIDLYRKDENFSPWYIVSSGEDILPSDEKSFIEPASKLMVMIAKRSNNLIRRRAFDQRQLGVEPFVYDYGAAVSRFTEISLIYKDGRPQMDPAVVAYSSESR